MRLFRLSFALVLIVKMFLLISFQLKNEREGHLAIIVNHYVTESELTSAAVVEILKGEKPRWKDRTRISIAIMKAETYIGKKTLERIYGMTEKEFQYYWLSLIFQGKVNPPKFFLSQEDLINYVSITAGTIGVISIADKVELLSINENVKVVSIDGSFPGDPKYPFP